MNAHTQAKAFANALDLSGTFIRRTNLDGANLAGADLTGADCTNASFRGANLTGTILLRTVLKGADLTDAVGLSSDQLKMAVTDKSTILPSYLLQKQRA
jgi:uncharacterized protein YjbI with pentapeptide repeats